MRTAQTIVSNLGLLSTPLTQPSLCAPSMPTSARFRPWCSVWGVSSPLFRAVPSSALVRAPQNSRHLLQGGHLCARPSRPGQPGTRPAHPPRLRRLARRHPSGQTGPAGTRCRESRPPASTKPFPHMPRARNGVCGSVRIWDGPHRPRKGTSTSASEREPGKQRSSPPWRRSASSCKPRKRLKAAAGRTRPYECRLGFCRQAPGGGWKG